MAIAIIGSVGDERKMVCVRHEEKRGRWRYDFSVNRFDTPELQKQKKGA